VGASANLPVILMTIYWKRFNRGGAITGMLTGLIASVGLVALSPNVWNPEPGKAMLVGHALFPLTTPGLISIPLGFLGAFIGTLIFTGREGKETHYDEIIVRASTGINLEPGPAPAGA